MTPVPGDDATSRPPEPGESPSRRGQAHVRVELFGLARSLVGQRALVLDFPGEVTVADALARLAADHPSLVGPVIRPDGLGLTEGHALNLNGRMFLEDVGTTVGSGDSLLILSNTAGG